MPKSQAPRAKRKSSKKSTSHEVETQAPQFDGPTPLFVPVAAIGAIVAGLTVIVLSFLGILPEAPQPQYNIVGLVMMSLGFVAATQIK